MPQAYIDIDIGPNAAEYVWISSVIHVSAMVILYYDYMITLNREIEFLWLPYNKQVWATAVCLLNRYISVLGYLPLVVSFFVALDFPLCVGLHTYFECLMACAQFFTGVLCIIRVHAIYGRSRRILGFLAFTGGITLLASTGAILASHYKSSNVIPVLSSFVGCAQFTPSSKGRFYDIAWVGVSFFDSVIFSLTLWKAYEIGRVRLMDAIVRDGAMYFSVLFIINLGNVFNLQFSPHLLRSSTSTVTNVLSSTLVSRLVLNLHEQKATLAEHVPTTIETEHRFQAALPVARESLVVETLSSSHPNNSIDETVTIGTFGVS